MKPERNLLFLRIVCVFAVAGVAVAGHVAHSEELSLTELRTSLLNATLLPNREKEEEKFPAALTDPWIGNPVTTSAYLHAKVFFAAAAKNERFAPSFYLDFTFDEHSLLLQSNLFRGTKYQGGATLSQPKRSHNFFSQNVSFGRTVFVVSLASEDAMKSRGSLFCVTQRDLPSKVRRNSKELLPAREDLRAWPTAVEFRAAAEGEGEIAIGLLPGLAAASVEVSSNLPEPEEPLFEERGVHPKATLKYFPLGTWRRAPFSRGESVQATIGVKVRLKSGPGYERTTSKEAQLVLSSFAPGEQVKDLILKRYGRREKNALFSCISARLYRSTRTKYSE